MEGRERAIEELREIRDTGEFNMFTERAYVMQYANQNNYFSLVSYCENDRDKYLELLKEL